jgi:serine/threonine protein kinase
VPRRRFDEYDDISSLVDWNSIHGKQEKMVDFSSKISSKSSGRHILLKAKYEGEDVVLKGFTMNNYSQRKGFEREISILGKLSSNSIICPGAIVEGPGFANETFHHDTFKLTQMTVFIQYPFCKGGNLSDWIKLATRKPWELQSIARQIVYVLMFLHDHGVIHKVEKLVSITIFNYLNMNDTYRT